MIKAKQDQISYYFRLMYYVNDFLTDFIRRLKSSDREDGNENSMFMCPLGLLEPQADHPMCSRFKRIYEGYE